jgi:dolichyl-phosphate beta-glucosyltransferase
MHGLHFLVSTLAVKGVRDTQCGFKLFSRSAALVLFTTQHIQRWAFDIELLFLCRKLKFPLKEIAVNWREIEGSKVNVIDASLQIARDMVIIRALYLLGLWRVSHLAASR